MGLYLIMLNIVYKRKPRGKGANEKAACSLKQAAM